MKIGFIGSGNMTSAIVAGMLKNDFIASDIYLCDNNQELLIQKQQEFAVNITPILDLISICNIVFLAVKPQVVEEVCMQIKNYITTDKIIVSIAAGITTKKLRNLLITNNIIRAMPNLPALVGLGATGIFSLSGKNKIITKIFNSFGISCWVDDETHIDIITALSGSGPAYFFLMFEAMITSSVKMGLDGSLAKKLCLQTALGSATMAIYGDIETLRTNITSKGGTTEQALNIFAENNFINIIDQAMIKAKHKAKILSS